MKISVLAAGLALVLAGCASVSPDGHQAEVQALAADRLPGAPGATVARAPDAATEQAVAALLAQPLSDEAAVRIALLNSPAVQSAFATLGLADAERVQAGRLPNPVFAFSRVRQDEQLEIGRLLRFDLLGLLTLPWRSEFAGRQLENAKLQAAQALVRVAADARQAWVQAVAARQTVLYLRDARDAAEAGAELAERMARAGNWSRLRAAREQSVRAEMAGQFARAEHLAVARREKLVRVLGLDGDAARALTLPERLPDLPATARAETDAEAQALRERLDVRSARAESQAVADAIGYTRVRGAIDVFSLGGRRDTVFADEATGRRETRRGAELELSVPLFDWGGAAGAGAEARYQQSLARLRAVAVRARSEAREAWHGYRTTFELAAHYRDEVVPLRKAINRETVLRYNGNLVSVWDLLAEVRTESGAIVSAIEAARDFWLADTDLQLALSGTSPNRMETD